jgi:hypothetical protein
MWKTHELRFDDRGFKIGDVLVLKEWDGPTNGYTESEPLQFMISHILHGEGLKDGYCVLSLQPVNGLSSSA